MGEITDPGPVKLFVGMLSQETSLMEELEHTFSDIFGPLDLESPLWSWEHTKYYQDEMGTGLKRKFIFIKELISPVDIAGIKLLSNELENNYLNGSGGRRINLDPGYLNAAKLVLVSTKDFSHRVYLDRGIYGEVTLLYSGNMFRSLPYTFPDYRTEEYLQVFKQAREIFKKQVQAKEHGNCKK